MTIYRQLILPDETPNTAFKLRPYPNLQEGKARIILAAKSLKQPPERCALILVMGMIETNQLSVLQRDRSKDQNKDGSANFSMFNLNEDMVIRLGYKGRLSDLNDSANFIEAIKIMIAGFNTWGYLSCLDYVRGGNDAFRDHVSWNAAEYRNGVATGLAQIDLNPMLMTDPRRIEMPISHQ